MNTSINTSFTASRLTPPPLNTNEQLIHQSSSSTSVSKLDTVQSHTYIDSDLRTSKSPMESMRREDEEARDSDVQLSFSSSRGPVPPRGSSLLIRPKEKKPLSSCMWTALPFYECKSDAQSLTSIIVLKFEFTQSRN